MEDGQSFKPFPGAHRAHLYVQTVAVVSCVWVHRPSTNNGSLGKVVKYHGWTIDAAVCFAASTRVRTGSCT